MTKRFFPLPGLAFLGFAVSQGSLGGGEMGKPPETPIVKTVRDLLRVDAIRREFVFGRLPDRDLKLDIYYPRTPMPEGGYPLIVWIHGGGWILGSKRQDVFVRRFPEYGFALASVEYRLATADAFPAQIRDVRTAVWWLRKHAGALDLDAHRFFAAGQSAGGHLALLLAYTQGAALSGWGPVVPSGTIQAVVAMYAPTDLLQLVPGDARENPIHPVAFLLGEKVEYREQLARLASPVRYVDSGDPATLLMHGRSDSIVPIEQSVELKNLLQRSGVRNRFLVSEDGHAFDIAPGKIDDILNFFEGVPEVKIAPEKLR